jgi:hypothetical protein
MESNKFIGFLVHSRTSIKLRHWKTTNDVEHRYLDQYYDEIGEIIDSFTEKLQGHIGGRLNIEVPSAVPEEPIPHLKKVMKVVSEVRGNYPTSLQNILDELLGLIDQTIFLLSLK